MANEPGRRWIRFAGLAALGSAALLALGASSIVSPLASATVTPTANWTQQFPAASPSARAYSSMAFDSATGRMVLFGGGDSSTNWLNDTWTYDGSTWTKQSPVTSPPARFLASMAFDAATGRLVLFGGWNGSLLGDTWTYDGSTWAQQSPATSPPARDLASMAYDPTIGKLVLFGGSDSSGYRADTWIWPGAHGGYWLVASDGGVVAHGDAGFHGSEGGRLLNKPVVGMASS